MAPGATGNARTAEVDALLADGSESVAAFRTTVSSLVARVACASAALAAAVALAAALSTKASSPASGAQLLHTRVQMVQANGTWAGVSGPCMLAGDGCVYSPNYPQNYANYQKCTLEINLGSATALTTEDFGTEAGYDQLYVNGDAYTGYSIDFGPSGVTPTANIIWTSDGSVTNKGWKICAAPQTPTPPPTPAPPSPLVNFICEVASHKQIEDKAVEAICQVFAEKFPTFKFDVDCKTDVEAVWSFVELRCRSGDMTLPSLPHIDTHAVENLICKVATHAEIDEFELEGICHEIAEQYPNFKFDHFDCWREVQTVWNNAMRLVPDNDNVALAGRAICFHGTLLPLYVPAAIEPLICGIASEKQIEDKAVDEICQVITEKFPTIKFNPDCKTDVETVWDKAVAECLQGCTDTSGDATGLHGYTCGVWTANPHWCGRAYYYADEDFTANEMCCACGGGEAGTAGAPTTTEV